ncbi:hypothetical protein P0100_21690 [Yersinia pestis]|nr:hypothetical protein [Yersinia pestis]
MKTMYPAQVNSPGTELAAAIDAAQDTIQVADGSVLPDGPNLLTIGTDEAAETILYTGKNGDELTGVARGFQGNAQSWAAGTKVARKFTAYDHDATVSNIGELSTGLKALGDAARDRLDIVERHDVVLNAGMQILNAQRRAAFSLSGIKGRTLVNLLGRDGGCESLSPFVIVNSVAINNTKVKDGSGSLKATTTNNNAYAFKDLNVTLEKTKQYMLAGWVYIESYTQISGGGIAVQLRDFGTMDGKYSANADPSRIGEWQFVFTKISASNTLVGSGFRLLFGLTGVSTGVAYFDGIRLYELSNDEYNALDAMTPEQIAAKYPYVDSVQPVRNPYAIRYGENFASGYPIARINPSNSERIPTPNMQGAYEVKFTGEAVSQNVDKGVYFDVPALPGRSYTAAVDTLADNAFIRFEYFKDSDSISNSQWVKNPDFFPTNTPSTVTVPVGCSLIRVYITNQTTLYWDNGVLINDSLIGGNYHFKNWRLFLGPKDLGFKPREDSMLALQTDLYADPVTGGYADEVFEKDGQYFKLAKWKSLILDGSINWGMIAPFTGFKRLGFPHQDKVIERSAIAVKYDGKILPEYGSVDATDKVTVDGLNLYVWVSNADTGWGDNYTPTPEERKAYFMGWKMYPYGGSGTATQTYDGTGTKGWCYRIDGVKGDTTGSLAGATTTLPTYLAPNWTPYQLVYQLATPTVESIISEGMLTFNEGDNLIEVGTGIVVRESAKFVSNGSSSFTFNSNVLGATYAKFKVKDFIEVFENNKRKYGTVRTVRTISNGTTLDIPDAIYDKTAVYSVTYLMLDTSPITPFIGSYAANEKAMLQELTDAVQQNATAVSVLMNKKADKDAPGWITPTLLNGWVNFSTDYYGAGYLKTSDGLVCFRGVIRNGTVGQNIFILPPGFRPSRTLILDAISHNNSTYIASAIRVYPDGRVFLDVGSFYHLSLESINPFLAEQ